MMTYPSIALCIVVAVTGCASAPSEPTTKTPDPALMPTVAQPTAKAKLTTTPNASPIAPADARMTLYCLPVAGAGHVERSRALKDQLIERTGWRDFYIIHGEDQSILYYGYYKDFTGNQNPREKQRAEADRLRIASFKDERRDQPFRGAMFVDLSTPDPAGPPEWNLANTPADRMWSLQIAAYKDSPARKEYAVDAVREARKQGIEAYYYHGDTVSSVCIGAFPRNALREQESDTAETYQSDQPIVVLPTPLPTGASEDIYVMEGNKRVKARAMAPRVEPVDPKLIEAMRQFPHHSVNGEMTATVSKNKRTGQQVQRFDPSYIVEIKHPTSALTAARPQPAAPTLPIEQRPTGTGAGQLKGLGE